MIYDVIIIGAGAAGLMTAIVAKQGGAEVLLLEGQNKPGAKILMSGGTRCNVTNKEITQKDYNSQQMLSVRNILRAFDNEDTLKFFNERGVEMVLEKTGKYFPKSNSGKTILEVLLKEAAGCMKTNCKVQSMGLKDGVFEASGEGFCFKGKNIVLATGGLSYPSTGSDGVGYRLAAALGHNLIETSPALTPLTTNDEEFKSLAGIALPVRLDFYVDGKKAVSFEDSFLFTHFGFSGPVVLDISRHWLRAKGKKELLANFLPQLEEGELEKVLLSAKNKTVKTVLSEYLPQRLVDVLLSRSEISTGIPLNQLSKDRRQKLLMLCLRNPLAITGTLGYSKAEITAGGIDWSKVNGKTLESKIQPGVFFVGEILDVDGRIGGFNFQWAWASGHVAGREIIKKLERNKE